MNIVSYRGPGKAGGVSSTFNNVWSNSGQDRISWWYIQDHSLQRRTSDSRFSFQVADIPQHLIDGHYKYCNNFLWPVMHDMPEQAIYSSQERRHYKQFNRLLAKKIGTAYSETGQSYFLQDYQFATMSRMLNRAFGIRSIVFWHIPWPVAPIPAFSSAIAEIADSLLHADAIGFHTQEYADNFANFVNEHLPEQYGLLESGAVELVVAPLGIDVNTWAQNSRKDSNILADERFSSLDGRQFILSVDRADYTKGVVNRLQAIDRFFERNPRYLQQLTFVQICGQTRPGLKSFDRYWQKCGEEANRLNARWSTSSWAPLLSIDTPVSAEDLALLYSKASMMLVNPIRDGLNLTAKEFAVCQDHNPGALLLSRGAGVWHELGLYSSEVEPGSADRFADALYDGLNMDSSEKMGRNFLMKDALSRHNLNDWWEMFVDVEERHERELVIKRWYMDRYSSAIRSLLKS